MSEPVPNDPIDRILGEIHSLNGLDPVSRERLFQAVYAEMKTIARRLTRGRAPRLTWQPTELVHEAFLHLAGEGEVHWEGRAHFFGIAARAMRQILVDHAREKAAAKRGGDRTRITLTTDLRAADSEVPVLEIHDALERLSRLDPRAADVAEKKVFGGLSVAEIAVALGVSRRTVDGDWRVARMWLGRELAAAKS